MNSLKLLECIGNIDEAYIAELERAVNAASAASDASAPVRKSRYKYAKYAPWLCAAAACLLFAFIGTHFLPAEEGIEKNEITVTETASPFTHSESDISQRPGVNGVPVTPGTPDVSDTDVTASPLTSAVPDTLEPPAAVGVPVTPETPATSVIPVTTAISETSKTPPEPYHNSEGSGGDEMSAFNDPVQFILLGIDGKLCGDRDVDGWFKAKRETNPIPDDLWGHANLYSFIHDFGIPREEAEAAMEYYINSDDPQLRFPTEIFDLIYSENTAELGRLYANAHTIAKGEKLYTPRWLYYHTPEEWTAAGITPDDVESRLHQYENIPFSPEGREYFGELISEFLGRRVVLADPYADWVERDVPVVEAIPEDIAEDVSDEIAEEIEETDIYP
ncbi:MAG: hypothetical protein K2N72_02475 [Oscillospiraceae bacterium]|nr:hypothetical protein [Oscillospiraceae bacterium]